MAPRPLTAAFFCSSSTRRVRPPSASCSAALRTAGSVEPGAEAWEGGVGGLRRGVTREARARGAGAQWRPAAFLAPCSGFLTHSTSGNGVRAAAQEARRIHAAAPSCRLLEACLSLSPDTVCVSAFTSAAMSSIGSLPAASTWAGRAHRKHTVEQSACRAGGGAASRGQPVHAHGKTHLRRKLVGQRDGRLRLLARHRHDAAAGREVRKQL